MSLESVAFVLYYLRSSGKGVANKQAKVAFVLYYLRSNGKE